MESKILPVPAVVSIHTEATELLKIMVASGRSARKALGRERCPQRNSNPQSAIRNPQ